VRMDATIGILLPAVAGGMTPMDREPQDRPGHFLAGPPLTTPLQYALFAAFRPGSAAREESS
jgi:hypothetical protein